MDVFLIEYFNKLNKECKAQYLAKISLIDDEDPYAMIFPKVQ